MIECRMNDATCELPKTCVLCGTTQGEALGHKIEVQNDVYYCTECDMLFGVSSEKIKNILIEEVANINAVIHNLDDLYESTIKSTFSDENDVQELREKWSGLYEETLNILGNMQGITPYDIEIQKIWTNIVYDLERLCNIYKLISNTTASGDNMDFEVKSFVKTQTNEAKNIISILKKDISTMNEKYKENSAGNKNYCIECNSEAKHTYINPFSGKKEYYCKQHYDKLMQLIDELGLGDKNYSKGNSSTTDISYSTHTDIEAWSCAQNIVRSHLKSPSSAKFCTYPSATITYLGNGKYKVKGWVEAQNGFGATLRENFTVTYTATESGYKNANCSFN